MGVVNVECFDKELQELNEKGLIWPVVETGGVAGEREASQNS